MCNHRIKTSQIHGAYIVKMIFFFKQCLRLAKNSRFSSFVWSWSKKKENWLAFMTHVEALSFEKKNNFTSLYKISWFILSIRYWIQTKQKASIKHIWIYTFELQWEMCLYTFQKIMWFDRLTSIFKFNVPILKYSPTKYELYVRIGCTFGLR